MKKLTILSLAILVTSANAFRGDWQVDSDGGGGGGAFIVGIILIVAAFNYFRDDELFGLLSCYVVSILFKFTKSQVS